MHDYDENLKYMPDLRDAAPEIVAPFFKFYKVVFNKNVGGYGVAAVRYDKGVAADLRGAIAAPASCQIQTEDRSVRSARTKSAIARAIFSPPRADGSMGLA